MLAGRRSHRARRSRPSALTGGTSPPVGLHACPASSLARSPRSSPSEHPRPPRSLRPPPPQPCTKHHRCVTARRVNPQGPGRPAAAARRVTLPQDNRARQAPPRRSTSAWPTPAARGPGPSSHSEPPRRYPHPQGRTTPCDRSLPDAAMVRTAPRPDNLRPESSDQTPTANGVLRPASTITPAERVQARAARSSSSSPRRSRAHHAQPSWPGPLLPWAELASQRATPATARQAPGPRIHFEPARATAGPPGGPPLELGSVEGLPSAHFRRPGGRRPSARREAYSSPGGPNDTPPGPRAYTDPDRPSHPGTTRQRQDLGSPAHSPPSRPPARVGPATARGWHRLRLRPRPAPPGLPGNRSPVSGQRDHRPG